MPIAPILALLLDGILALLLAAYWSAYWLCCWLLWQLWMAYWVVSLVCCALFRLAEALQHCPQLETLRFDDNSISDEGASRLQSNRQCPIEATANRGSAKQEAELAWVVGLV